MPFAFLCWLSSLPRPSFALRAHNTHLACLYNITHSLLFILAPLARPTDAAPTRHAVPSVRQSHSDAHSFIFALLYLSSDHFDFDTATMSAVHAPAPHSPPLEYSSPPSSPPSSGILSFLPDLPLNLPKLGRKTETRCKSPPPKPSTSSQYAPLSHPLSSTSTQSASERERNVECGDCLPLPLSTGRSRLARSGVGRYVRTLQLSLRSPARNPIFLRDELDMIMILLVMFNIFVWTRYFFA